MAQYNYNKEILPERFIEIFSLLCQSEFMLSYINFADLIQFIGKCKKANLYTELVGAISILENDYSPELIKAINICQRKKSITFDGVYISIVEMSRETQKRIIELDIEDLDLMRSFITEFLGLREKNDPNQIMLDYVYAAIRNRIKDMPK